MPMVRVEWLPGRTVDQKRELAEVLTREVCRVGKCTPEAVQVVFADVPAEDWAVAGTLLADG